MPETTPLRFVVLHHTGLGEPHFDLMLERSPGGPLQTFRLPDWPVTRRMSLTPLGDHRPDYLDYEGPVSGGRGAVRRVAAGTYGRSPLAGGAADGPSAAGTMLLVLRPSGERLVLDQDGSIGPA